MPTPREAVQACPPHQHHTPRETWQRGPLHAGPLTRAVTRTREPPTSGLVLGAQVPGPDVQGLSPAPARPGGQNSQRHGPSLSWAQAREPSLFLPTGWGWGWGTQDPSFPETQDGGSGEASSTPWPAPLASPPICGNSETTHRQGIPNLLLGNLCGPPTAIL